MKLVVYTCTFLDYDIVFPPLRPTPGARHVLFSDRKPLFPGAWEWRPLPPQTAGMSQSMANRWCKFFPHRLFPDADASLYLDACTLLLADLRPLADEFEASGADIGLFSHIERRTVAEELAFCKQVGKLRPDEHARGDAQIEAYRLKGTPDDLPLTENAVIFRRHAAERLDPAMRLWWDQLERHTPRDQLSLPHVLHETGLRPKIWPWNYKRDNPYFERYPHRKGGLRDVETRLRNVSRYGPLTAAAARPFLAAARRLRLALGA